MILAKKKSLWKLVICHEVNTKRVQRLWKSFVKTICIWEGGVHSEDFLFLIVEYE